MDYVTDPRVLPILPPRPRALAFSLFVSSTFATAGLAGDGPPPPAELLEESSFPSDLRGWTGVGDAEFAADGDRARGGHASARMTVRSGTSPAYQQLRREFTGDIVPDDEYRVTVWMTSEGLSGPPGAYLALECLGSAGERVGIFHSEGGTRSDPGGWRLLVAKGRLPAGTRALRICLVLHANGTAWFADPRLVRSWRMPRWPDLGDAVREIRIRTGEVLQPRFGGVGFHAYHHLFPATPSELDEVIYKRWRELNPSFVRINHEQKWDERKLDEVAAHLRRMQETGTEIYLTTWDPPEARDEGELRKYARRIADHLEHLIRGKGLTGIRTYCVTNELSLGSWGRLAQDLPRFRAYHRALFDEFAARRLDVGLLATDASPESWWWTIEWAANNMDEITAVYGGHHYITEFEPSDDTFYPWFRERLDWAVGIARARGKGFILGEFGSRQDGRTVDGVKLDVCAWWGTPQEPLVALQLADAAIAALESGAYALGYWTFSDHPDFFYGKTYQNKWGTFRWTGSDRSTRAIYYGYGLLTKFFRGPATVVRAECSDPRVRAAAVRQHGTGAWSIAALNRNGRCVPLRLAFDGAEPAGRIRKYVYDPARVPQNPFGDLQAPSGTFLLRSGRLEDTLGASTINVYTTVGDEDPPGPVGGLRATTGEDGKNRLEWKANPEPDLCYYRIHRSESVPFDPRRAVQIGSTTALRFVDGASPAGPVEYRVVAVDGSGNAGR